MTKAKAPKKVPTKSKSKLIVINIKLTPSDLKEIRAKARKFSKGNTSAWIRHTGKTHMPKAGEKILLKFAK